MVGTTEMRTSKSSEAQKKTLMLTNAANRGGTFLCDVLAKLRVRDVRSLLLQKGCLAFCNHLDLSRRINVEYNSMVCSF